MMNNHSLSSFFSSSYYQTASSSNWSTISSGSSSLQDYQSNMTTMMMLYSRLLQEVNNATTTTNSNTTTGSDNTTETTTIQANQAYNDASTLRNTLRLYGTIFIICLLLFCYFRRRYPKPYNIRNWVIRLQTPLANQQYAFLSWMYKLYFLTNTELLDECGMDALCYTRVLEFGVKISLVGMFVGIFLMPVYATAPVSDETVGITDSIVRISTSNVGTGDPRFIATVLAAYVVFGYTMYMILQEFNWFYLMRYQFLKKPMPRNYSVYVRNIPEDFLSSKQLRRYFQTFASMGGTTSSNIQYDSTTQDIDNNHDKDNDSIGQNGILESDISLKIPNLKKKVNERANILSKLEHAINVEDVTGKQPRDNTTGMTIVDTLYSQLDEMNVEVTAMIEHIEKLQQIEGYDAEQRVIQEQHQFLDQHPNIFTNTSGGQSVASSITQETPLLYDPSAAAAAAKPSLLGPSTTVPSTIGEDENDDSSENQEDVSNSNHNVFQLATSLVSATAGAAKKTVNVTADAAKKTASTAADAAAKTATATAGAALSLFQSEDGLPLTAGFITFTNLQAVHSAQQMIQYPQPFAMEVLEAPGVDDIFWQNVGKTHKELQFGKLFSMTSTVVLCLFWTVPMSFIASLSSVEGLKEEVPWIANLLNRAPWLEPVLAQLAPLLIVVANLALKMILEFLSGFEGPVSGAVVQASLFAKLSVFMIIQTFFVSALSGSIVSQLSAMVEDTTLIIDLLATTLPSQSTYFIQILLVDTAVSLSVELLRVSAIVPAAIRAYVGPRLTEEERQTTWFGLRPLADPREFEHADLMSITVLYFVVFFVYATLAPITSYFMFACFLMIGAAYRHQFVYIYPTKPDSGGQLWIQFMKLVPACILIGEVTVAGFLALKRTPAASALMIPLLIITILFTIYIGQAHFAMARFLPARECIAVDQKNKSDMTFLKDFKGLYVQPEMREKKVYPSNASLDRQIAHGRISDGELSQNGMHGNESPRRQKGALESVLGGRPDHADENGMNQV